MKTKTKVSKERKSEERLQEPTQDLTEQDQQTIYLSHPANLGLEILARLDQLNSHLKTIARCQERRIELAEEEFEEEEEEDEDYSDDDEEV